MPYELIGPQHVGQTNPTIENSVIEVILNRNALDDHRNARTDGKVLALAIEGGGMAGYLSAGMCVTLEQAGLINAFDNIYGTSSGALNGAYLSANQAAHGSNSYLDLTDGTFYSKSRLINAFRGKSVINMDYLFEHVVKHRWPLDYEKHKEGPEFRTTAVDLGTMEAIILGDFYDEVDLFKAIRASCAMPVIAGPPENYKGKLLTDGAIEHSVPYRAAFNDGATHVLALRSRGETYRKDGEYPTSIIALVRFLGGNALAELVADRPRKYDDDADILQNGSLENVYQIALPGKAEPIKQLEQSVSKLKHGFKLGAMATAKVFGLPKIDVVWDSTPKIVINNS